MCGTGALYAEVHTLSDAEALITVLTTAIQNLLDSQDSFTGKTVALRFSSPCELSKRTRDAVEWVISGYGKAITYSENKPGCLLFITVTDSHITLQPHHDGFTRTVSVTVHIKCVDASRKVIFASGRDEYSVDELSAGIIGLTDDSAHFCKKIQRRIVKKESGKFRIYSALFFTGILAYFSFQ